VARSSFGLALTIGGILATVAFVIGHVGIAPNVERLVGFGGEIAAGEGPPTPGQAAEMHRTQTALERASKADLVLLLLAVAAMATARYW
jgi:hypothetical protein